MRLKTPVWTLGLILAWSGCLLGAVKGDLNGDGIVDAADSVTLQNYLAGNLGTLYRAGELVETDTIVGNLRCVPAGSFVQGSTEDEPCRSEEEAQFTHVLTLDLAVMETEVTRQMWADLRAAQPTLPADPTNPSYGAGMKNPVQTITWYEAVLFANLLSAERGLAPCYFTDAGFTTPITSSNYTTGPFCCDFSAAGYRLLTEGEWEYCCRAGTATPFWISEPNYGETNCGSCVGGSFPILETAEVFCASHPGGGTAEVASKLPNPWGLYDTHGNVMEWCWDWYGAYPSSATDYQGAASGDYRVMRGGYYSCITYACRSAMRSSCPPYYFSNHLGFRLARGL